MRERPALILPDMSRALIIESDAGVAKSLAQLLGAKGVETQITADGTEGVTLARTFQPDVIVLCVELSRVSGYSICNKLKKDPDLGRIPLVLTSSQATEETFEQHKKLKTRAEAYLKKPYTDAEILAIVTPHLGAAAPAVDVEADADEMDVHLDEVGVDFDDVASDPDLEATPEPAPAPKPVSRPAPAPRPAGSTLTAVRPAPLGAREAREAPADKPAAVRPASAVRPATAASAGNEAQLTELRNENKLLRQKVQKLEESIEQKELEFNDRLLQESSRGREGLEARKKLAAVERDVTRAKELADKAHAEADQLKADLEKAQQDLDDARAQSDEARAAAKAAEAEKQVLATKIGQLVDKVKSLAAERDGLQQHVDDLSSQTAGIQSESETAAKVREKARKAVDIAMQLIDETGLVH